jgi:hypothetical protein
VCRTAQLLLLLLGSGILCAWLGKVVAAVVGC